MTSQNYAHSVRCTVCRGATVSARLHTTNFPDKVVVEAKYVCPRCNSLVKRSPVSSTPKKK